MTKKGAMKSIFIDCNDQLAPVWAKVIRADDPQITVNRTNRVGAELPQVIDGYEIALDDHSYMPTELIAQCPQLKHIVFLGTGAASYMNIAELKDRGISVHTIKSRELEYLLTGQDRYLANVARDRAMVTA